VEARGQASEALKRIFDAHRTHVAERDGWSNEAGF